MRCNTDLYDSNRSIHVDSSDEREAQKTMNDVPKAFTLASDHAAAVRQAVHIDKLFVGTGKLAEEAMNGD